MNRKVLFIPLVLFLLLAAMLLWQLARNAQGDDPTNLESALVGKPVPVFRLESLESFSAQSAEATLPPVQDSAVVSSQPKSINTVDT